MAAKKSRQVTQVEATLTESDSTIRMDLSAFQDCHTRCVIFNPLGGKMYIFNCRDEETIRESRGDPFDLPKPIARAVDGL